jgi:hypothetical protein
MKKGLLITVFSCVTTVFSFAQKIAEVKQINHWLSCVKIDGKHTEWPQPLSAFNKTMHCRYSLANDDKNLYLAIKSDRTGKIMSGGITFIVNKTEITFPYNKKRDRRLIANRGPFKPSETQVIKDFKEIHVKGIPGIKDSLISLYNQQGIKVMINEYADKADVKWYDYELCIPLKYLPLSSASQSFLYVIRFNGIIMRDPGGTYVPIPGKTQRQMMEMEEGFKDLRSVSKLSGRYTLAPKP